MPVAQEIPRGTPMTDQPSQRAMKAAKLFCREDASDQAAIATQIDAEFPAYLEIREALERCATLLEIANVGGKSTYASEVRIAAQAALAKARKEK